MRFNASLSFLSRFPAWMFLHFYLHCPHSPFTTLYPLNILCKQGWPCKQVHKHHCYHDGSDWPFPLKISLWWWKQATWQNFCFRRRILCPPYMTQSKFHILGADRISIQNASVETATAEIHLPHWVNAYLGPFNYPINDAMGMRPFREKNLDKYSL